MTDPAEKYRDNVSPEHRTAMQAIGMARVVLSGHREVLQRLIDSERHMHNVGHILNPTLYRDMIQSRNFERQTRVIRAALRFLDEVDAVAKEIGEVAP